MRVWLDDIRDCPENYNVWAKTADRAIKLIETGKVTHISFDHDLGTESTGYTVACFIETSARYGLLKPISWEIHSQNPVGAERISIAMTRADEYWYGMEVL